MPNLQSIPYTDDEDFCIIKEILQTLTHTVGRAVLRKLIEEKRKEKMVRRKRKVCTCMILPMHNTTKASEGTSVGKQRQQLTLTEMSVQPTAPPAKRPLATSICHGESILPRCAQYGKKGNGYLLQSGKMP